MVFEKYGAKEYTFVPMKVRNAKTGDVEAVHSLITTYAEKDRMLFRSKADIYENLQSFMIVESNGGVVGCCALQIIWSDLAEIKSLAVDKHKLGSGVGKMLVNSALDQAARFAVPRVFALTLEPDFFDKLGFEIIEKDDLPMKVWSDCAKCSKQENCDEIAVVKTVI